MHARSPHDASVDREATVQARHRESSSVTNSSLKTRSSPSYGSSQVPRYYRFRETRHPHSGEVRGLYPWQLRNPRYFTYADDDLVEMNVEQANEAFAAAELDLLPA